MAEENKIEKTTQKPPLYIWRLHNGIVMETVQTERVKFVDFLENEAKLGYELVQMMSGPYWLFKKRDK